MVFRSSVDECKTVKAIINTKFRFAPMKRIPILFFLFVSFISFAQTKPKAGIFYFALGSHVAAYTNSDIHLQSSAQPSFDFVLHNVKARDDKFLQSTGGAVQYDYQFGYYSRKKNFGIEYNFDHVKYFAKHDQVVRTTGTVNGQKVDADLPITTYVQNFEHSNGGNYFLLNFVKWKDLAASKNYKRVLDLFYKAGAGIVLPRTNSTVMNERRDDKYNVAGYVIALEGGLRYNFIKNTFFETSIKGAFANYKHILIANGTGDQHWFSGQFLVMAGFQF
jgi:hypothetical protein